jgi:hypothetical protein
MRKSQTACERKRRRQERERKNMQQMRLVLLTTICVREQGRRDILRRMALRQQVKKLLSKPRHCKRFCVSLVEPTPTLFWQGRPTGDPDHPRETDLSDKKSHIF